MQLTLPPRLSSVPTARHWVTESYVSLVAQGCCTAGAENALLELLTSEAVANAVLHGTGDVVVDLACAGGSVRVAISDGSDEQPVVRRDGPEVIGGHGMALIDTLADRWGISTREGTEVGKTIWFELVA